MYDPFDPRATRKAEGCTCGEHDSQEMHDHAVAVLRWQGQLRLQTVSESEGERAPRFPAPGKPYRRMSA